ncbi:MAG: AHH domain-containing protein [Desulfobacteraceae bacterium]|nr:AHH domain-containing protein [Desulfobacteraceae bacterium]
MPETESMNHELYKELKDLHKNVGTFDNGSCLTGHLYPYKERQSCSYRWQGLKKARENKEIYNRHRPDAHIGAEGWGWASAEQVLKEKAGKLLYVGETATKSKKKKTKVKARNFTNAFVPYANNPHHVLPESCLANAIESVTKEKTELVNLIAGGLLEEKYNINHKDNIMIMPCCWKDGCRIGLPTHPRGNNHPNYRYTIENAVKDALEPYQQISDQGATHDKAKARKLKKTLEDISNDLYGELKTYGETLLSQCQNPEVTIDDIPQSVFTNAGL